MIAIADLRSTPAVITRNRRQFDGICGRCILCDAPIRTAERCKYVRVHDGGMSIVTEAEAEARNLAGKGGADCGAQPIGPECYRKHKIALAPYMNTGAR